MHRSLPFPLFQTDIFGASWNVALQFERLWPRVWILALRVDVRCHQPLSTAVFYFSRELARWCLYLESHSFVRTSIHLLVILIFCSNAVVKRRHWLEKPVMQSTPTRVAPPITFVPATRARESARNQDLGSCSSKAIQSARTCTASRARLGPSIRTPLFASPKMCAL